MTMCDLAVTETEVDLSAIEVDPDCATQKNFEGWMIHKVVLSGVKVILVTETGTY